MVQRPQQPRLHRQVHHAKHADAGRQPHDGDLGDAPVRGAVLADVHFGKGARADFSDELEAGEGDEAPRGGGGGPQAMGDVAPPPQEAMVNADVRGFEVRMDRRDFEMMAFVVVVFVIICGIISGAVAFPTLRPCLSSTQVRPHLFVPSVHRSRSSSSSATGAPSGRHWTRWVWGECGRELLGYGCGRLGGWVGWMCGPLA